MPACESRRSWTFDVRRSIFKLEWPGVEKVDVEIGDVEALAAKYPDVADDLRAFPGSASSALTGERVSRARTFLDARKAMQRFNFFEKIVSARRRNQHERRLRYPIRRDLRRAGTN